MQVVRVRPSSIAPGRDFFEKGKANGTMSDQTSITVSIVALVVAFVALITTVGQTVGQFFATADGYRRCQPSVMGGWAKLTHRRFRWSEMRFETLYTTPAFCIAWAPTSMTKGPSSAGDFYLQSLDNTAHGNDLVYVNGSNKSSNDAYFEVTENVSNPYSEVVSWVSLIGLLHANARDIWRRFKNQGGQVLTTDPTGIGAFAPPSSRLLPDGMHSVPALIPVTRSWDFVPPEVVRPLASVNICDIAILARRLGMSWRQFEPAEGNLKAEGNGHTITSASIRSTGTVLQINASTGGMDTSANPRNELYVPSERADKMGFGIVPGCRLLLNGDYRMGTEQEVLSLLRTIDRTCRAHDLLKGILAANPGWTPGISDIIGFASPMIRLPYSTIVRIPQPSEYVVGLTQSKTGFVVFYNRLSGLIAERESKNIPVSKQTKYILEEYEFLKTHYPNNWEDPELNTILLNSLSVKFLNDLHARHHATTVYFSNLLDWSLTPDSKGNIFSYESLIFSHITHAVSYFSEAQQRINATPPRTRPTYDLQDADWIIEAAHIYFDNIPKVADSMRKAPFPQFNNPEVVEEAWLTMMFRAFLWHRSHVMVEGPRVASAYWGSKLPVYIG